MVNTRAKTKRSLRLCSSQSPIADSDHQFIPSADVVISDDDLLTEILLRLPVRSVLRFKSVSKRWRSIISHRRFSLHRSPVSTFPGLFIGTSYVPFDDENPSPPPFPFRALDFYFDCCGIRIVQSCNGLLLCCSDLASQHARRYSVCNPTTKQFDIIRPVPGGMEVRRNIRLMALSFDPAESHHYKIVCIHRSNYNSFKTMYQIQVYSSETQKWKVSGEPFSAPDSMQVKSGVYWNNAVYWAASCTNTMYYKLDADQLEPLPLQETEPPFRPYTRGAMPLYFGESRGHLHLVENSPGESLLHLNVYEMEGDHSRWFLKYRVELDELARVYRPEMVVPRYLDPSIVLYYNFKVSGVIRGEKEEDTFMVIVVGMPGKVIRYNIGEKRFQLIHELNDSSSIANSQVHLYIQSLASF